MASAHHTVLGGATLTWAGATDVGRVRNLNEDSLLIEPPMFVVADGMGGHEAGEVASALTVSRLQALRGRDGLTTEAVAAELRTINSLLNEASADPDATMGTTGVGLVMVTNGGMHSWLVFNVGDSRAYCLEDGGLRQISRDHSYVQELIDAGELDGDDRGRHPHRNVVTRALGADEELHADYWIRPLRPGERFLLCSDGLTGEVDDDELTSILAAGRPAAETVTTLVDRALAAGGRDNVTAVVVDVLSVAGWDDVTTGERPSPPTDTAEVESDTFDRTLPTGPPPAVTGPPAWADRSRRRTAPRPSSRLLLPPRHRRRVRRTRTSSTGSRRSPGPRRPHLPRQRPPQDPARPSTTCPVPRETPIPPRRGEASRPPLRRP